MPFRVLTLTAATILASIALNGCGKEDEKKSGDPVSAQLALKNGTGLSLLQDDECPTFSDGYQPSECWTPSAYGLKILNVTVSPDEEGAKTGPAGTIWMNEACKTATAEAELEEDVFYEYDYMAEDCSVDQVEEFFDLARTTEEVNAELNSQAHKILPGTYNYVQVSFCIGTPSSENAQFQAEGMSQPYQVTSGVCGISSAKATSPIVVKTGETVTISLTYDLTNAIYTGASEESNDSCYVSADGAVNRCFGFPTAMTPSFVTAK
jgi:hypothetical protein